MDTQWCLTCNCHVDRDGDLYCSVRCAQISEPALLPSSSMQTQLNSLPEPHWPAGDIDAWRGSIHPGPPPSYPRSASPSASSTSSSTPRRTRPKLVQMATSPVSPSVSLTYSSDDRRTAAPLPSPPASPPRDISPSLRRLPTRHNDSRRSSMTCTTEESVATPVTPAVAMPGGPAPVSAYKLSLWKQVRSWVGPMSVSPQPRQHAVLNIKPVHFPAFHTGKREQTLVLLDEDLAASPYDAKAGECYDPFEEDDGDDDSVDHGCGLAGWFAERVAEQRRAKEARATAAAARERAAYAARGRKLERAESRAAYYNIRR